MLATEPLWRVGTPDAFDGSQTIKLTNWHNERGFGKVTRTVLLPDTVDPSTIAAELTSGVLHVTIGKRPESQPKKIEVKVS